MCPVFGQIPPTSQPATPCLIPPLLLSGIRAFDAIIENNASKNLHEFSVHATIHTHHARCIRNTLVAQEDVVLTTRHTDHFLELLIAICLGIYLWHALHRAWRWSVRVLNHVLHVIPWHTLGWVGSLAGILLVAVMVARHRVHRRRFTDEA